MKQSTNKNRGEHGRKRFNTSRIPKLKAPAFWTKFVGSPRMTALQAFLNRHALLMHIPLSLSMVFAIEWMSRHSFMKTIDFVVHHTGAYLYNSYIVFVVFTLVFLVTRKTFLRMIISAVIVMLGIVNGIILINRVSPFGYTDISMIGDLLTMQNTKYFSMQQGIVCVIAILIYAVLMIRLFIHGDKVKSRSPFWVRLILVILSFVSVPFVTRGLQSTNVLSAYFGNLAQGYSDYGYLYGFGTSIFGLGIRKPVNYTEANVHNLVKSTDTGEADPLKVDGRDVNVVVVLLESYFDPTEAKFIEMNEDPIPYFHELEKNYSSGHLTVPVLGAGTCDTEFEVLTGMSMQFFGPGEYPQKTILKKTDVESYADNYNSLGYQSHVVHDNGANFYSRQNAFSMMGFHDFTSKEMLDITEYNPLNSWPMDGVLIDSTRDAMDQTDAPDFTYTITVATHGNYPEDPVFDENDPDTVKVNCVGKDEATNNKWKYYINMLHLEDQWIRDYIQMLSDRDEPTLVIMFGDHLPTMGLESDEVATGDLYKTKYITWNNFGMEKQDEDLTSYNLLAAYSNRLGIHGGTMLNFNQTMLDKKIPTNSLQYTNGLQMLEYDLLYGKRYAYGGDTDKYPPTDIIMGVHDVVIDRIYTFNDQVNLYGDQFTKWSDVYVNGEPVKTGYESGQHLTIDAKNIKPGDRIVVNQMGSGDDILRSSNEVTYTNPAAVAEADKSADTAAASDENDGTVDSEGGKLD